MDIKKEILSYYDQLASKYDENRFENSYGKYLDQQERSLLSKWLKSIPPSDILDLGCGTGRLLDFAESGADFSKNMLAEASKKYPNHRLIQSDVADIKIEELSFQVVYSMHVVMHLDQQTIQQTLAEVHRILKKDGLFVFDFPNKKRRKLINYKKAGWHGNTAMELQNISEMIGNKWTIQKSAGFLLFPIHRFPKRLRPYLRSLDSFLCQTPLKHFASYYCVCLKKK